MESGVVGERECGKFYVIQLSCKGEKEAYDIYFLCLLLVCVHLVGEEGHSLQWESD